MMQDYPRTLSPTAKVGFTVSFCIKGCHQYGVGLWTTKMFLELDKQD